MTSFRMCFEFEKLEKKKKNLESSFPFHCLVWEKSNEKNREENYKENLICYEEKIFLSNMRGKWKKNLFLIVYQKSQID